MDEDCHIEVGEWSEKIFRMYKIKRYHRNSSDWNAIDESPTLRWCSSKYRLIHGVVSDDMTDHNEENPTMNSGGSYWEGR